MNEEQLDPKLLKKISGKSYAEIKDTFLAVYDSFTSVSDTVFPELITIYVKFYNKKNGSVFGVVWLKTSKEMVVGLSMPKEFKHPQLQDGVKGYFYSGLSKFLVLSQSEKMPQEFPSWVKAAYSERGPS